MNSKSNHTQLILCTDSLSNRSNEITALWNKLVSESVLLEKSTDDKALSKDKNLTACLYRGRLLPVVL